MDVPLSNRDIECALKDVHGFKGVTSYDQLPRLAQEEFCIVNTDNVVPLYDQVEGGHHWLTVCCEQDQLLIFDSFGRSLEQMEIDYTEPRFKLYFFDSLCLSLTGVTTHISHSVQLACVHFYIG